MIKREVIFAVLLILTLALGLRVYDLSAEGLWNDEAFSVHHASEASTAAVMQNVAETEAAPWGYYVLLHYFGKVFGYGDFSMRFLSVIFSVLSILVLYLIGTRVLTIPETLLACLLMATSMLQVLYSQEARLYSLFTFVVLTAAYCFILILQTKKNKFYFWYLISIVVGLYVNYITFLIILLFSLILLFFYKEKKELVTKMLVLHGFAGILALPLISLIYQQFTHLNDGLTEALLLRNLPHFLASFGLFFYIIPVLIFLSFGSLIVVLILKHKKEIILKNRTLPDRLIFLCPLIVGIFYLSLCFWPLRAFGLSIIRTPITHSYFLIRHSFFLAPLFYVFLAKIIFSLNSKRWKAFAVFCLLLVNVVALGIYYHEPTRPQWKEATELIASSAGQKQPLILLDSAGISNTFLLKRYYLGDFRLVKLTWDERWDKIPVDELIKRVRGERDFWLILSKATVTKEYYREVLDERYERISSTEFLSIKVYHYAQRP